MTIKEIRKSIGLSQSKFANYFGINVRALQNWEIDRVSPPPYLTGLLARILELEKRVAELEGTELWEK